MDHGEGGKCELDAVGTAFFDVYVTSNQKYRVRLEFELTAMVFTVCFRQGYDRLSLTLFTDALRKKF